MTCTTDLEIDYCHTGHVTRGSFHCRSCEVEFVPVAIPNTKNMLFFVIVLVAITELLMQVSAKAEIIALKLPMLGQNIG